jgi:2-keto-4-pentenoate hydratase
MTTATRPAHVTAAHDRLLAARQTSKPCPPVRDLVTHLDDAYLVQSAWVAQRIAAGAHVVGRKIGLTNPAVQSQLGVDSPDFGVLLDEMAVPDAGCADIGRLLQPRIEAEVAFVLAHDLDLAAPTDVDVVAATAYVVAALEIVDSRIAGWDITLLDTVADNASAGLFVLGSTSRALDLDLAGCAMTMSRGGDVVSTGLGRDCLGSPVRAVAWLASTAHALGAPLRAGDIVLSGALGPVIDVRPGDTFAAEVAGVGGVSVTFSAASAEAPGGSR